ncbi:MAG: Ig-like domain-containing protein [Candidatus Micrarchaeota archaeon]
MIDKISAYKGFKRGRKGQSTLEYFLVYGWALLLALIVAVLLYIFIFAPSAIAPNSCSFAYGAYCQDMILGSNSISSKIALFLTNTQQYPIINPQVSINISNIGTVNGKCLPSYVLPGGAIICNVTMPIKAISTGTLVSGKLYLSAIPCPSGNITTCTSGQRQTYVGNFNSHAAPLLASTTLSISISAANSTATIGIPDELIATVKLLGYPISGATVNFTANKTVKFNPSVATTDSSGDASTQLTSLQQGKIKVYASFGNVSANTTINFLQPVYITFNTSKMYNTAQTVLVVDGSQYSYINLPVTFAYAQNSKHTYAFYSPIQQGSAGNARYVYYSISGCGLHAQKGVLIARYNCTVTATYKPQYFLSIVVNPSGAGFTIPPPWGNNWYYPSSLVYIIALPAHEYIFQGWAGTGNGSYTGNRIIATVVMNSPITEQANFYSTTSTTSTTTSSISTTKRTTSVTTSKTTSLTSSTTKATTSTITSTTVSTTSPTTVPNVQVTFEINTTCYYTTSPMVYVDGVGYACQGGGTIIHTFTWAVGTQHNYSFNSTVYTTNNYQRFYYKRVSGCGLTSQSGTITASSDCTVTGYYSTQYLLSMTTSPSGAGTVSPGTEWLNPGASVTINETPKQYYEFNRWVGQGTGSYSGTSPSATITVGNPVIETANYTYTPPKYNLYLKVNPANSSLVSYYNNNNCHAQWNYRCWGDTAPLTGDAGNSGPLWVSTPAGWQFVSWTGTGNGSYTGTSQDYQTVTLNSNITETLNLKQIPTYKLYLKVNPANSSLVSYYNNNNCHAQWNYRCWGDTAPLTGDAGNSGPLWVSTPAGWQFVSWTGTGNGSYTGTSQDYQTVTLNSNITETLNLKPVSTYSITFAFSPSPGVNSSVCSTSQSIVKINNVNYTCSQLPKTFKVSSGTSISYSYYTPVYTSYPVRFAYSSVSGCGVYSQSGTITASSDCTVTGYYSTQYLLSMTTSPSGAGTVSPGTEWLNPGASVTINETPNSGYKFNYWVGRGSGSYSGNSPSATITLNGPIVETANYST